MCFAHAEAASCMCHSTVQEDRGLRLVFPRNRLRSRASQTYGLHLNIKPFVCFDQAASCMCHVNVEGDPGLEFVFPHNH